jgi:hypothetical protein
MPSRILREGILTSERVATLGWAEEIFYRRLMSVADDFGRYTANPKLLRAACYPLLINKVSDADIEKWLACVQKAALVSVYLAKDGKWYLEIKDFRQRTRASCSKFPPPPDGCLTDDDQLSGTCPSPAHVVGDGDGDGGVYAVADAPAVVTLPLNTGDEFPVTQAVIDELTPLYPSVDVLGEIKRMRGWLIGNPAKRKTSKGVMRFITSWLDREQDKGRGPAPSPKAAPLQKLGFN